MELMDVLNLIVAIVSGIATCIPLVVQLVKYVKAAIAEKNFNNIMKIVIDLMPEAEEKFATGEERKEYVMNNIRSLSKTLGYEIDFDKVSEMIDLIIAASKKLNVN
jgi:hypothetical protein